MEELRYRFNIKLRPLALLITTGGVFCAHVFMVSGGIFGLFNGEMDRVLNKEGSATNDMTPWPDIDVSPL